MKIIKINDHFFYIKGHNDNIENNVPLSGLSFLFKFEISANGKVINV